MENRKEELREDDLEKEENCKVNHYYEERLNKIKSAYMTYGLNLAPKYNLFFKNSRLINRTKFESCSYSNTKNETYNLK